MTAIHAPVSETVDVARLASPTTPSGAAAARRSQRSLSTVQRLVVAAATLPLLGIAITGAASAAGLLPVEQMIELSLGLGEEPGMAVFAAMLCCSPIQWVVHRTQVPVRKMLGILFSGYAVSNFVMFGIERGFSMSLSAPFLVAGTVATVVAMPLLLTSGRWAQRKMGMRRWRSLHKLTYLIAVALILHLALVAEFSVGGLLITVALAARIPPVERAIRRFGQRRRTGTDELQIRADGLPSGSQAPAPS